MHREDYLGKEVLILGGGDGGILCELLKETPKFVTMAEVMKIFGCNSSFLSLRLKVSTTKMFSAIVFALSQIDDDVIKACKKHLRGVCYDALDHYDGDNHRIVLEDCVKVLRDFASRGKKVNKVVSPRCRVSISTQAHI